VVKAPYTWVARCRRHGAILEGGEVPIWVSLSPSQPGFNLLDLVIDFGLFGSKFVLSILPDGG